ncbi:MAG: YlqD family protein [bacterium]|jgi:hypothetical protein
MNTKKNIKKNKNNALELFLPVNVNIKVLINDEAKKNIINELESLLNYVEESIKNYQNKRVFKIGQLYKGTFIDEIKDKVENIPSNLSKSKTIENLNNIKRNILNYIEYVNNLKKGDTILLRTINGFIKINKGVSIKELQDGIDIIVDNWIIKDINL